VKGKGEGRNRELAECAMRRDVSVRAYEGADEETGCDTVGEGTGVFSKKSGEEEEKRRNISQESPQVFIRLLPILEKRNIFLTKPRPFETKSLLLRLTKHNFPFIPPHCGVHIAQSRGTFPDHSAQMLFDLPDEKRMIGCTSILKVRLPRVNKVPDGKAGGPTCGKAYDESRLGKVEPLVAMYPSSSQSRLFMDVRCSHSVFAVVG